MTSTLTRPTTAAPAAAPAAPSSRSRGRRGQALRAVVVAAVVAALAALAVGRQPPQVVVSGVVPTFGEETQVVDSAWGSPDLFGVEGSRILAYDHDTEVVMRVPWSGGEVRDARLGEDAVHLVTVTGIEQDADGLAVTLHRDNCRYFHERAIDMFPHVTLDLADGSSARVVFDRPLFVKSPMLASCPDRTLDRQDHVRG